MDESSGASREGYVTSHFKSFQYAESQLNKCPIKIFNFARLTLSEKAVIVVILERLIVFLL